MSTSRQIVTRAIRRLGLLDPAESPSAAELADGLSALNEMISSWESWGLAIGNITLTGAIVAGSDEVSEIDCTKLAIDMFVTGTGIPAATQIKSVDIQLGKLLLTAEATASNAEASLAFTALPFESHFEAGIVAMLAVRLAEDYGKTPGPVLTRDAQRGEAALYAAFTVVPRANFDLALTNTPSQRYIEDI